VKKLQVGSTRKCHCTGGRIEAPKTPRSSAEGARIERGNFWFSDIKIVSFCAFWVVLFIVYLPVLHVKMVHLVQFLVTRSIAMQCDYLGKVTVFFVATYSWYFCHCKTAFYHCTIASYHSTFCVSLHSISCPGTHCRRSLTPGHDSRSTSGQILGAATVLKVGEKYGSGESEKIIELTLILKATGDRPTRK